VAGTGDDVIAAAAVNRAVAVDHVIAEIGVLAGIGRIAIQGAVTRQRVVATTADQRTAAEQAGAAVKEIVSSIAEQGVGCIGRNQCVVTRTAMQLVVVFRAIE